MLNELFKISVLDFAKKAKLSVDVVLELCQKVNINVTKETDFLIEDDVRLLCKTFDEIFPDVNIFLEDKNLFNAVSVGGSGSASVGGSGGGGGYVKSSVSKNNGGSVSLNANNSNVNNSNNVSSNVGSSDVVNSNTNSSNSGSSNNETSNDSFLKDDNMEESSLTSNESIQDNNIEINVDNLYLGANLVSSLEKKLSSLKSFLSSISVIPPVSAAILNDCVAKASKNIEIVNGTIKRINDVVELFPVLDNTANECFDLEDLSSQWSGIRLDAQLGLNLNGPDGQETWYDLDMSGVVHNMEKVYHYTNLEYSVREDGVKLLSGVTPDGQVFKNLVLVAAHVQHPDYPDGNFQRGQIVQTSLGWGIVADQCGRSADEWRMNKIVHFDIATAWRTGKYATNAYDDYYPIEYAEQLVPGQDEPIVLKFKSDDKHFYTEYYSSENVLALGDKDAASFEGSESNSNDKNDELESQQSTENSNNSNNSNNEGNVLVSSNIQPKNNSDIAHRGHHPGGIYENSSEAYRTAGENGFWGCEADVRFDSSGNLVCSHNAVKSGETPPSFGEYLDICKEYGMTAVIDLKYERGVGPADPNLSPAILKTIEEKGMLDSCILQTNNYTDIPYIREHSDGARIWYLTDQINESNLNLIEQNNVECVNVWMYGDNDYYRDINKLSESGVDVCVWGVTSEKTKQNLLEHGATYVMSDYALGTTPYQEGQTDFNNIAS